jgi:hypothetical protein
MKSVGELCDERWLGRADKRKFAGAELVSGVAIKLIFNNRW